MFSESLCLYVWKFQYNILLKNLNSKLPLNDLLVFKLSSPFWGKQYFKYPKKVSGPFISCKADILVLKLFLVLLWGTILNDKKEVGYSELEKGEKKDALIVKKCNNKR